MNKIIALIVALPLSVAAQEQAKSASAFLNSIGVNTNIAETNSAYSTFSDVLTALSQARIYHVRDTYQDLAAGSPFFTDLQQAAKAQIKVDLVVPYSATATASEIESFMSQATNVEAIEYPNQVDANGTAQATWTAQLTAMAPILKEVSTERKVPLYGPSLTLSTSFPIIAALDLPITDANLQVYFNGDMPETSAVGSLDSWQSLAATEAPSAPVIVSETGYNSIGCSRNPCPAYPASPWLANTLNSGLDGNYTLRTLLSFFNAGVTRTYIDQLFDDNVSPNAGLIFSSGWAKRAYLDIYWLNAILDDSGANPATETGSLTYSITGSTTNLQHTLLQAHDGSFWLALWLAVQNVNPSTGEPIPVASQAVTLTLPSNMVAREYFFQPSVNESSTIPAAQATSPKVYPLTVSDQVTLLHID